ncbi:MAG: type II toxin-antitoxin system VapC family toxin [Lewinella sp.]|jgi:predicted nucleic acid-binding protein|uniref:type II toxin-antitoxin system VapC family toxin n=1 Tax=Lewinella sp. TaxID=2004506 RepID=UPI003D6BF366
MDYLLDTNVIIIYSKNRGRAKRIEADHKIFVEENNLAISIVSIAEINSVIHQFKIGDTRRTGIDKILENTTRLDISYDEILEKYEEIDAYSQGKHRSRKSNFSAKNMGKNDLWIAATASAFNITLVTTDRDFNHLDGEFLDLKFIDLNKYK